MDLPGIVTRLTVDLAPQKAAFDQGVRQAQEYKQKIEREFATFKPAAIPQALRPERSGFDAEVRDVMASRLRAMRSQTRQADVAKAAESMMFGDPQKAASSFVRRAEQIGSTMRMPDLSALEEAAADASSKAAAASASPAVAKQFE